MSADMDSDHEQKSHKKSKSKRKHQHEDEAENGAVDMMDVDEAPESTKKEKKKSKDKKHKEKTRESDVVADIETTEAPEPTQKEKKKSKDKKRKDRTEEVDEADAEASNVPEPKTTSPEKKKHKRQKSSDEKQEKKHKKSKHASSPALADGDAPTSSVTATTHQHQATVPSDKEYPFFTQAFSQRIPVWPAAFDEPLTKISREYLDPLLNRYSPKFRGVLLAYKNVNLSDRPRRAHPDHLPTDDTPVILASFECYAPPFAWLTADLHLFVPSRGAWMEGVINLQSEGHIGVICFDKFNASISRRSLPKGWKWVEHEEGDEFEEPEEDPFEQGEGGEGDGEKTQQSAQLRSTGHWVDEKGERVSGKVYFRIKNFSSGSTGDYTYLSLQGTMLDDEAEKKAAAEERAEEKARRARSSASGLLYPTMRLPESSMTKLRDILV